jgi:hypothetical protein
MPNDSPPPVPPPLPVLTGARPSARRPGDDELIDQGPCLVYRRLSHRRRFWRTVYLFPANFVIFVLPDLTRAGKIIIFALSVVVWAIQAGAEYAAWQREKQARAAAA